VALFGAVSNLHLESARNADAAIARVKTVNSALTPALSHRMGEGE